ncbi:MAG: hypothetical protein ABJP02_05515 [Parasphingorhabdus sp.]|uniref:hypothetical protein n=1 Tax=Parasphingorhabdus sp. TaxID=2709688 RepID=UPI003299C839
MWERICWSILALIHLLPSIAFFVPSLITRLYGVAADNVNFALLQHRAALFCVVGIACIWAAVDPGTRKLTFVLTAFSMISFLVIFGIYGQPSALRSIAFVDLIGLPFLAYVGWRAFSAS